MNIALNVSTLKSYCPINNELIGSVNISTEAEIKSAVRAAHRAKNHWNNLGLQKRIDIMRQLFNCFNQRRNDLCALTVKEMGKTITETSADLIWDFDYFSEFINNVSTYIGNEVTYQSNNELHQIVYEPKGVAACIVPWNFPFANFVWSVVPNLLVGNTVVFKHSEVCPLFGKLIEDIIVDSKLLPVGVFNQIYGAAHEGELLLSQPIDLVWFTGSSLVGKHIFKKSGEKFIKSILEMGGSNPAIIFDDVDVDSVVNRVYSGRFTNCGQVCDAVKRLIVHRSIFNELLDKLTKHLFTMQIGDPTEINTNIGPLASMEQLTLITSQVEDAKKLGANIVCGGRKMSELNGAYYLPTLVTNITSQMRIWKEEVFGPVLPIVAFDTEEEAINLANDTAYGLGAVVCSTDLVRAHRVAKQIDAGFIDINNGNHWRECNPFGGFRDSGMGYEHGKIGFQELCKIKVIAEG